jgi:hypothetical protein
MKSQISRIIGLGFFGICFITYIFLVLTLFANRFDLTASALPA